MQVILLSDVKNVGKKYDIVDVAPGYARNFLLAKDLCEVVTKGNAKRVADLGKKREIENKRQQELLEKAFSGVSKAAITIKETANEEGHLYAGVTAEDLALELSKAIGAEISADHIMLEKPLKEVGSYDITAELGGKKADFKVVIEAK